MRITEIGPFGIPYEEVTLFILDHIGEDVAFRISDRGFIMTAFEHWPQLQSFNDIAKLLNDTVQRFGALHHDGHAWFDNRVYILTEQDPWPLMYEQKRPAGNMRYMREAGIPVEVWTEQG